MSATGSDARSRLESRLGAALTGLAVILYPVLLWRGWGRWADVLVDAGREVYVPWRLVSGDVLYRDIAWFNGPLSPYWNASIFRLGEVGLRSLLIANALFAVLVGVCIWLVLDRVAGRLAAGAGVLYFLPVFALGHFIGYGSYNFLFPYSHEMTHGFGLSLVALLAVLSWHPERGRGPLVLAGLVLGLVFLTKPEIFLAAAAGLAAGIAGTGVAARRSLREIARCAGVVGASSLVAPLLATGLLSLAMPARDAVQGTLGGWTGLVGSPVADLPFYRKILGIDDVPESLRFMLLSFARVAIVVAAMVGVDLGLRGRPRAQSAAALAVLVLLPAALFLAAPDPGRIQEGVPSSARDEVEFWMRWSRHLTLSAALACGGSIWMLVRSTRPEVRIMWARRSAFAVFALALLGKMALNAMAAHYGFVLALAASLVCVAGGLAWLPAAVRHRGGSGLPLQAATLALLVFGACHFWGVSRAMFELKSERVGRPPDAFQADPMRGVGVNRALEMVAERLPPGATLLVLPEGVMVNFLARRRTPTRHLNFMPPELLLFGEAEILRELRERPPDAVLLIHKDTREYGFTYFGRDYGRDVMAWVRETFPHRTRVFGQPPLAPGTIFGIELLEPADGRPPRSSAPLVPAVSGATLR